MSTKIGFIGYGAMSSAMIKGLVGLRDFKVSNIMVTDRNEDKKKMAQQELGVNVQYDAKEIAGFVRLLIIAVKPGDYQAVVNEIKDHLNPKTVIISLAAGLTIKALEGYFDQPVKLVRAMPNLPVQVQAGMTAIKPNKHVTEAELKGVSRFFDALGQSAVINESLMDAAIVTSGSAPAYVYMMIEAMIQGGIKAGMSKEMSTRFVTQAMLGATKMVMETGENPKDLRDAVCSPNGTTIEAVNYLNDYDFSLIVQNAMKVCKEKSRDMSKSLIF